MTAAWRIEEAQRAGRSAALNGEPKSSYLVSCKSRDMRSAFELGYYEGLQILADMKRDIALARQQTRLANKIGQEARHK